MILPAPRNYPAGLQLNFWEVTLENGSFDLLPKPDIGSRFPALFKSISCTAPTGRPGFVFDYEAKVEGFKRLSIMRFR